MATDRLHELVDAPEGQLEVLQGNLAFAVGCARGGIHAADGYPGTPSTEVIDKGLRYLQDRMRVGWSVNEANGVAVGFGATMAGADALVTMKIPGLFQAGDVVATAAGYTAQRGGLVLFIASDFVPSSTQYVTDPRYFLKSCFIPILEPRTHQEMAEVGPLAAKLGRRFSSPVAVLANGLLCHSEGLVRLPACQDVPLLEVGNDYRRFMNLPEIARRNYDTIVRERLGQAIEWGQRAAGNRIEWASLELGVVVHGATELYLREVWDSLPVKPSVLSLGMTFPVATDLVRSFVERIVTQGKGRVVVLGDGLRFVQEELRALGLPVEGKELDDPMTEWTPETLAARLGARARSAPRAALPVAPVKRPATICAGCPYRAFGLVVQKLRKQRKIVASFGDIGCNTLLYFLDGIDTCTCMGASDAERQGVVWVRPTLAGKTISVLGDSTECHSGLDATRNAVFRNSPGVKVVLDNATTAMTGGQPAPSSSRNLAGQENKFELVAALRGEGARVELVDAFDMKAIEKTLRDALARAEKGEFSVMVVRGPCIQELAPAELQPRYEILADRCKQCDLCYVCSGIERGEDGFPRFTHLCNGCGGHEAICRQRCHLGAIELRQTAPPKPAPPPPLPPEAGQEVAEAPAQGLPEAIRVAVRGVGGQGNLFLGKVLAELARLAGFANVVKGETHGMAQLGGAVLSTFACGKAFSPVLGSGTVDVLVVLEQGEILRPGFLELLRPGGVVLLNELRLLPATAEPGDYPPAEQIRSALAAVTVVSFDALAEARAIGDTQGRTSNVVALGLLSTTGPLGAIPLSLWHKALLRCSPSEGSKRANWAAFERGRAVGRAAAPSAG